MGPTLFNIFINNIDSGIEVAASASLKMSGAVDSVEEKDASQKDLDRLGKRTHAKFNKAKYKVLHVVWGNP